ncbi:MAG: TIGR03619 family F420-dependent LLM class oxidoreductase [Deltaproteobacteria bacterium]|nr:TIGR03619 family F420-dependent LLM class oxidoreductase [Deltaproteobacteria bacterium]
MKFAIRVPAIFLYPSITSPWEAQVTAVDTLRFARRAEAVGFDYLWVSEHIVQIPEVVPFQGPRFYEAVSAAGVLLGATSRVRLLTYIAVLPYHNPLMYAKQIATVDVLSGGRLTLGLASGHLQKEFQALGVSFAERGRRSDEYLKIMHELWSSELASYRGEFYSFENVIFEPKPTQKPHPPIYLGGDAKPIQRRAARLGDGWIPWLTLPEEIPDCMAYINQQRAKANRTGPFALMMLLADFPPEDRLNLSRFRIPKTKDEVMKLLDRLQRAGANGAIVHLPMGTRDLNECIDWLEWFATDIIPTFRK